MTPSDIRINHRPRRKKPSLAWHRVKIVVLLCLLGGIFGMSAFFVWAATIRIPDFSLFNQRKIEQSTKIYDRTGKILLYDVHRDIKRTVIDWSDISPNIKNATVAIEDDQFYNHVGVEPRAIIRAILVNLRLREGYIGQGGSTITQQVIKNAMLSKEKTLTRKAKEWVLAVKLERMMAKEDILALYLNEAPYGGNIYGVEEASLAYFGKNARDVSIAEAAYLAALPQAPTTYSPYGSHKDRLEARKEYIIERMRALGMITEEEYAVAKKETVKFLPQEEEGIRAPHFVMFVKQELVDLYGEEEVENGGLRVITTLDADLQITAEKIVKKYALENTTKFNASNAALVAIDPKQGGILAMVGSRDYFDTDIDGNYNIAVARRQPGSAFKPFVYALAFEKGFTPDTVVFDVPTQFSTLCDAAGNPLPPNNDRSKCYMPTNYDGQYRGPISFRNALAQSINIPAVKALYLVGIDDAIEFAERLGVKKLTTKDRYGLTLVLGGGEVTLLDMTSAYGVFANDGKRVPYEAILRIEDSEGGIIKEFIPKTEGVLDPEIAREISDVLSDNAARAPAFGPQSYLYFPDHQVAVKTGTTNDYRDAWIVGYTPNIVVGAWAGNNDNTPMEKKVAGFIVAPLWNEFFVNTFQKIPDERFPEPSPVGLERKPALRGVWEGGQVYVIDKISGKLATPQTPPEYREERVVYEPHEILHFVDKDDPMGPAPAQPDLDPQYYLWEIPARAWLGVESVPLSTKAGTPPTESDDVHTQEKAPRVRIISPTATTTVHADDILEIALDITNTYTITRVDYALDGIFLGSVRSTPFSLPFIPREQTAGKGEHTITATVLDEVGNKTEAAVSFLILEPEY